LFTLKVFITASHQFNSGCFIKKNISTELS